MQNRLASLVLLLTCGLSVSSVLAQEPVLLEDIEKGWKTKTINNVVNGSFSVMLERFDQTWPTWMVASVRDAMEKGLSKEVLDEETELTVTVDAKNGYAEVSDAGTDGEYMSACYWNRPNGHKLLAVLMGDPTDPFIEFVCFYDYDPQRKALIPEPDILAGFRKWTPQKPYYCRLPKKGKNFIIDEYGDEGHLRHTFAWDGMKPVFSQTEAIDDGEMTSLALTTLTAQAKNTQMAKIRQFYAEAKTQIAQNGKNGMAPLDLTITVNDGSQVDEDFIINENRTLTYYFNKHRINSALDYPDASLCYFIIERWEANGHSCYREILLDPNEGSLLFSFTKSETHAGYVTETRYYYDGQGNLIEQKQKAGGDEVKPGSIQWNEDGGDQASVDELLDIFDWVMNPGHELAEKSMPIEKTTPKAERLKTIRSAYAAAKAKMSENDKADIRRDVQIVIRDQSWGPPETHTVNYYYDIFEDYPEPDAVSIDKFCYFISERHHHNNMGSDIYNEYLFTPTGHHLIFSYTNAKEEGEQLEWRYYFDENGKCIETKTNSDTQDAGKADQDRVRKLVMIFQKLTN